MKPRFACTVVGYYTDSPEMVVGKVEDIAWKSTRVIKRRAELLVLMRVFDNWARRRLAEFDEALAETPKAS